MKEKKYLTLYGEIKEKILSGEYKAGDKLPSKRVMADMRGMSVVPVEQAYSMLTEEGYIEPRERSGYFVSRMEKFSPATPKKTYRRLTEPHYTGDVDFEKDLWFKTIRKVMNECGDLLFLPSPGKGCEVLRNAIADYLQRYRGMYADPNNIIIGSGSEQLYEMAIRILGKGVTYAIEIPSYLRIEIAYERSGVDFIKLPLDNDGIKNVELVGNDFDVLHVTPFNSYPTGVTASASKRVQYLNRMKGRGFIIEDDWGSEFFPPGQPIESLYSMDRDNCVIYMNTFSKSLSPSVRIGYMILPPQLMLDYQINYDVHTCTVPVFDQYVLAEFINSGNFERHLNRRRRKMRRDEL